MNQESRVKNKKWEIIDKLNPPAGGQNSKVEINDLLRVLLENRGIKTEKEQEEFLNPKLEAVSPSHIGINKTQLKKALIRIDKAIEKQEEIIIFGDYDVDGVCGAAIVWETLSKLGARVMPYIPHRIEEGYGLSIHGIENLKCQTSNVKLIITVDNGIVAERAVEFAKKNGIDVIITDHHVPSKKLPEALAIVHTTKLCGAGVAWVLAQELKSQNSKIEDGHLELVALATVADLVPLLGANRTLLKFGLKKLQATKRVGLLAIFQEAGIEQKEIDAYIIGHIIAPRLNAMGRLSSAMDSLRLLCTTSKKRAKKLAQLLCTTNKDRQNLTIQTVEHAVTKLKTQDSRLKSLLFVSHESYQQGVIGLVAGKLVEQFYHPAIVVSKGSKYSKASARSIKGFNIIEFIRTASDLLLDAGGHPMAAGFTVETEKLSLLQQTLEQKADELITGDDALTRVLRIDCQLPLDRIDYPLYNAIQKLSPFGMGNPEPVFLSDNVIIEEIRTIGRERQHLKFEFGILNPRFRIEGIGFSMGDRIKDLNIGDTVSIVYAIDENKWNGSTQLQLKVKDIAS